MPYIIKARDRRGHEREVFFFRAGSLSAVCGAMAAMSCGNARHCRYYLTRGQTYVASNSVGDMLTARYVPFLPEGLTNV